MRPTKTVDRPRHLSDQPLSEVPVIARHLLIDLTDEKQTQAGTNPKATEELGYKGRGMAGR